MYLQKICNSVSEDAHRPRLRSTDHGDLVMPHTNTDNSVGAVFLCQGRTSGTSCHLKFAKCPIKLNNLLEHWKLLFPNSTDKHFWGQHQKEGYSNDLNISLGTKPRHLHNCRTRVSVTVEHFNYLNININIGVQGWPSRLTALQVSNQAEVNSSSLWQHINWKNANLRQSMTGVRPRVINNTVDLDKPECSHSLKRWLDRHLKRYQGYISNTVPLLLSANGSFIGYQVKFKFQHRINHPTTQCVCS